MVRYVADRWSVARLGTVSAVALPGLEAVDPARRGEKQNKEQREL